MISIFRIINILKVDFKGDVSFTATNTNIWSVAESCVAILVGCGPILPPILVKLNPRKLLAWARWGFNGVRSRAKPTKGESYGRMTEDQFELVATSKSVVTAKQPLSNIQNEHDDAIKVQYGYSVRSEWSCNFLSNGDNHWIRVKLSGDGCSVQAVIRGVGAWGTEQWNSQSNPYTESFETAINFKFLVTKKMSAII